MKTFFAFALLSATLAAGAQTSAVKSDAFAAHAPIATTGAGPYHQLVLPLAVYQGVHRADLSDLRVFNAQGEPVPHALLKPEPRTTSKLDETGVPLFPIIAAPAQTADGGELSIDVRKNADGTLVSVRQAPAAPAAGKVVRGAVLDISRIKRGVRALRLTTGQTSLPFHRYSVETSDDLQHWRLLKGDAQLVRMEHDGQRIDRDSTEWDADAGKYLRILWAEPRQAPQITAAHVGVTQTSVDSPSPIWSGPIAPAVPQPGTYEYSLAGRMPLEKLRINLPQVNTLAPVTLQYFTSEEASRRRQRDAARWDTLAQTVIYRLQSPQGEVKSPEIALYGAPQSRLRLVVDARSGGIGSGLPTLEVGFVPHTLVFLARGEAPFTLAWGAPGVANAALDAGTLMPGYRADQKLQASQATLNLAASAHKPTPPAVAGEARKPVSKGILWAVLLIGVLVLGGMAAALLKQMKQKPPRNPEA